MGGTTKEIASEIGYMMQAWIRSVDQSRSKMAVVYWLGDRPEVDALPFHPLNHDTDMLPHACTHATRQSQMLSLSRANHARYRSQFARRLLKLVDNPCSLPLSDTVTVPEPCSHCLPWLPTTAPAYRQPSVKEREYERESGTMSNSTFAWVQRWCLRPRSSH
jgi:hypothetical protein